MQRSFGLGGGTDPLASFHQHLARSTRVLALCGAGLSASSGLPTFRGAGGLWRTHISQDLATPSAFQRDPGLVWQFYSYRRHMALRVDPNPAHRALAKLARKMPGFLTLTQNVDGLSQRANHPSEQLLLLHGSLFDVKCVDEECGYSEANFTDPIVPALSIPVDGGDPTSDEARKQAVGSVSDESGGRELDISDSRVYLPSLPPDVLPQCPQCQKSLLRPGVVWFGESLPEDVLDTADNYVEDARGVDLIMVIGTSAQVSPAASYIEMAREQGARVCVVNMDENDTPPTGFRPGDWQFIGDSARIVPDLLKPVIGDV